MKKKINIKKTAILSASLVGAMLFGLSAIAAQTLDIHSRGIFQYLAENRQVILDSADFETIKATIGATDNETETVAKGIVDGKDQNLPFTSNDLKSAGIAGYSSDGNNNDIIITAKDFDALADRFSPYTTFGQDNYAIQSKGTIGYDDPTTDSELEPEILIEAADFNRIDDYMKAQTRHTTFRADGASDRTNDTVPAEIVIDTLASWDTPGQYVFTAPETGSYKLIGYGAQGGNTSASRGGLGGYTEGVVHLDKGQKLYVTVGGQGKTGTGTEDLTSLDGYNGGGSPWPTSKAAGGGGMTTFSTAPALADSYYTIGDAIKTYDEPLTYNYTGSVQSVTLPKGKYQIEVYGAQGGGTNGGKGGYEKGIYEVTSANETLYLYVGGQGTASSDLGAGGGTYGGGHGGVNGYGGGGMTYVSKNGSDNLQAVVNKNTWSESGLINMDDDAGDPHYSALFNNLTWTNNRGYDEYVSLYAGRFSTASGTTNVSYRLSTPSSSKNGSKLVSVDSGSYGTKTYDPDALVATILVKNGETLTYYAYAPCSCANSSYMNDPTLFLIVGSGSTSGTNYTADKSGTFNTSSVLLAAGGGGGAGNATTNARGGAGAGYEEAGRPYVNGTQVGVKMKTPATQAEGGGSGQGGSPDGGRFIGCGESATYTTNTGGAGGGYYGGYVTNSTNGGAGGGAGYVNASKISDASSGVGVNSGNGRIVITEIPKKTYIPNQSWTNSDKVLMAAAGGGGAGISVGQGGAGGNGGGYVAGVGQSGTINTTDAGAGGGGYTGGKITANSKAGDGGQNYTDGVSLGKSKSGKRKGNGYAGIIYLSASDDGVIDISINDDMTEQTITAHPGTQLTFPKVEKKGYTLTGWYATKGELGDTPEEGTQIFAPDSTFSYQPILNYTYWAKWEGNHFNVIFDKNDVAGSNSLVQGTMEKERFEYDEAKALTRNSYTRRGYTFLGWSTDKNRTPEAFKVSIKRAASDEDPIDDITDFTDGSTIKNLSDKIEDITLYAVWEPIEYSISYDLNRGSSSTVPVEAKNDDGTPTNPVKYNVESYKTGSELVIASPSMDGYTFKGWTWTYTGGDNENYTTTVPVIEPSFKNIIGNISFKANWEANKYTVHFVNNIPDASKHRLANIGGVGANSAIADNIADECYQVFTFDSEPQALSLNGLTTYPKTETGYLFLGWSSTPTEEGVDGNVFADDAVAAFDNGRFRERDKLTPLSDVTEHMRNLQEVKNLAYGRDTEGKEVIDIYGCWGTQTYRISYNLMDASEGHGSTEAENPNTSTVYTIGSNISLRDATRPGYTFDGWTAEFTSETNDVNTFSKSHPAWVTNPTKESDGAITLSDNVGDVVFTAHWTPNKYTVHFINNIPEASKHRLANIGGVGANNAIAENTAAECYQVFTFDSEPTALSLDGTAVYPKSEVGYTFLGWSSSDTEALSYKLLPNNVYADGDMSLYNNGAFRSKDKVEPLTSTTEHIKNLQEIKNLSFGTDTAGTTVVDLYGCWGAKTYTITYKLMDKSEGYGSTEASNPNGSSTYTIGSNISLKDAVRPGYTFTGWTAEFTSETDDVNTFRNSHPSWLSVPTVEADGPVTLSDNVGDVTFTAHYNANTYTIEFNKNGSDGTVSGVTGDMADVVYTFDNDPVALPENNYSRTGYNFLGWSTNATLSDSVEDTATKPSPAPTRYNATVKRAADEVAPSDSITIGDKGSFKNISFGTDTNGTTRITLYAIWDATEYPVNIDMNDVSSTQDPVNPPENNIGTYTIENSFTLKDPAMTGYTFLGWTGSNGTVPGGASVERGTTGEKSYKANWRANNYTVKYDYNDSSEHGTLPSDQDAVFDETVTFAANNLTKDDAIVRHEKIARIYFDANGGTATQDSTEVSTKYDMGTEYRANGWKYPLYDGTEGHGTSAKNLTAVDGKTVILRPYWDLIVNSVEPAITCYTTTTGESGGTQVTAQKTTLHEKELYNGIYSGKYYQYRDKVTTYTFNGWWTAKTGGSQVTSFAAPSGSGDNNNKTVYAHYAETVTYDYSVYPSNGTVIYPPSSGSYGTWNGSTKGPGTLSGASASGTKTATAAGDYTVTYTPDSGYCWADGTRTAKTISWSIERASISKPTAGYYEYDGTTQGPGYKSYMDASGTVEAINHGSYTAYYTPDDNHCWSNGTYGRYTLSWSISKVSVNASTLKDASYVYTGSSHSLPAAPTGSTRSGTTTITNVGSATATYTLKDKTNYVWSTGGTSNKTVTYTVTKADQNITVTPTSKTIEVGDTFTITVLNARGSVSYTTSSSSIASVSSGTVTGKGKGTATITVKAAATTNYNAATERVTVNVKEKVPERHYRFFQAIFQRGSGNELRADWNSSIKYQSDMLLSNDTKTWAEYKRIATNYTSGGQAHRDGAGGWDTVKGSATYISDPSSCAVVYRYFGPEVDSTSGNGILSRHYFKSGSLYYSVYSPGAGGLRTWKSFSSVPGAHIETIDSDSSGAVRIPYTKFSTSTISAYGKAEHDFDPNNKTVPSLPNS